MFLFRNRSDRELLERILAQEQENAKLIRAVGTLVARNKEMTEELHRYFGDKKDAWSPESVPVTPQPHRSVPT